jgi:hypothetical protein
MSAAVKAPEADAELLETAASYHRMREEDRAFWASVREEDDADNKMWDAHNAPDGLWTRINNTVDRVAELPASTPAGRKAKASVLDDLIREQHSSQIEANCTDQDVTVAMSLIRDLVGDPA